MYSAVPLCNRVVGRFSRERLARSRRPTINVFARLIEIYVLIHSRIGGIGEYIVPVGRYGGKGMGEWMGEGRWRGHNERREKELERGRRSFRFCVFAVNLQ